MRSRWASLLFVALSLALYANALGGDFLFDDLTTFRRRDRFDASLGEIAERYRPVRYVSLRIDRAIFDDQPWGYHLSNALLHGVTSFVVFVILRRLAGPVAALSGALLFVAHPVHTESVAYISGRRDILTTLFFLLGFLAWLEFNRTGRRLWLLAVACLYGLALGAKEMAVTLPAICVLHDVLADPARAKRRIPLYAAGGVLAAGVAVYIAFFTGASRQFSWHGGSMGANFATSARLVVHYALLLVFPLRLVGDYSFESFPLSRSFLEIRVLLSVAAIGAAVAVAVRARPRSPLLSLGIGWFLVTLLPVLHIKPFHELAAEHYLYLPSVGFCLLAGLGFSRLGVVAPRPARIALGLVLLAFAARTVVRNRDWKDSATFWNRTAADAPRCARAHLNVGIDHAMRAEKAATGQEKRAAFERAAGSFERAVAIRPDYVNARVQLGRAYSLLLRPDDATRQWEEALRIAKGMKAPAVLPGDICVYLDRREEAIRLYEANVAAGVRAGHALRRIIQCHAHLAAKAANAGRADEALKHRRGAHGAAEALLLRSPDDLTLVLEAASLARAAGESRRADELRARATRMQR